ncbi:MAG: PIN domain-containing protein [Chloroflexi bacterium]|nr:PIN domain-containing protein [Chloroflexota bacterium]
MLDVNVLVAFLWPPHVHHAAARSWFAAARAGGWATCPITQLGGIRVLANPVVSQRGLTVPAAAALLSEFVTDDRHTFWPADIGLMDPELADAIGSARGPSQLTDRYLLALAAAHGGTLATFDRAAGAGLAPGSTLMAHLEIIEA